MASTSLFWSDLPGIPRKMKWPIKVVEWESPVQNKVLVYNMSDDAYFRVDKKQLKEFPGDLEKLKEIGIVALRRKKNVQEAFVKDIHWALNIQPQEYVSDTTDNEEDTISEIFPILFGEDILVNSQTHSTNSSDSESNDSEAEDMNCQTNSTNSSGSQSNDCEAEDMNCQTNFTNSSGRQSNDCEAEDGNCQTNSTNSSDSESNYSEADDMNCQTNSTNSFDSESNYSEAEDMNRQTYSTNSSDSESNDSEAEDMNCQTHSTNSSGSQSNDCEAEDMNCQTHSTNSSGSQSKDCEAEDMNCQTHSTNSSGSQSKDCEAEDMNCQTNSANSSVSQSNDCEAEDMNCQTNSTNSSDSESNESEAEDDITRDCNYPGIFVRNLQKSQTSKWGAKKKTDRVYNSHHFCLYCKKKQTNFSHHLVSSKIHQNETKVQEILQMEKSSTNLKERKRKISLLRLLGDHEHNCKVLEKKKGEVILGRRSSDGELNIDTYGPCSQCLQWVKESVLKRHQKCCPNHVIVNQSQGQLLVQSNILTGRLHVHASQSLINEVFPIMLNDDLGSIAKSDTLIINLGNQWMLRNVGNKLMRKYYTSSVMRLSARLKKIMMNFDKNSDESHDLNFYLKPQYFELVAKSALVCCNQTDDEELQSPSNAIKLGYDIKRMASAKLSMAIMEGDKEKKREAEDFMVLMNMNWGLKVTKLARVILMERKFNQPHPLPLPSDIEKLARYLLNELAKLDLQDRSYKNWKKVVTFTESRITLYNRRRCNEVQTMSVRSYNRRKTGVDEVALSMLRELTSFEKSLLNTQEVVEIRGKTGRGVPVIIPRDIQNSLKYLASDDVRNEAGIHISNPYLFANCRAGVIRAYDSICVVTSQSGLESPHLLRSTNMRKYMATMLQSLNTTENERQWVIDHLGHTMDVHKTFYRQTSDVIERTDIAKLLLIQDQGLVSKFIGKTLQEIEITDIVGDVNTVGNVNMPDTEFQPLDKEDVNDDDFIPDLTEVQVDIDFDDSEDVENEDDDYDVDESDLHTEDLSTVEFTVASSNFLDNESMKSLAVEIGPSSPSKTEFINEGFRRVKEKSLMPSSDVNQKLMTKVIKFVPENTEGMWFSIDGEAFEAMPIEVKLFQKKLNFYCNS